MEKFNLESKLEQLPTEDFSEAITKDLSDEVEIKKPEKKRMFLKALCMSVAATTLGLIINHVYQHKDKVEQEGENFTHSDQETEHILNVLCGKEDFTEKEKLFIYKQITIKTCRDSNIQIPKNLDTWSVPEFITFNKQINDPSLSISQAETFEEIINSRFFMKNLHAVLWKLEKKYGSPNIRWSISGQNIFEDEKYHRSNYNPISNTINLAVEDMSRDFFENYVAEIAHAKQFHEKPTSSYVTGTVDCAKTLYSSIISNTNFDERYLELYNQGDTLEYEAHKIIQKPLETEAWGAMGTDYEDK